MAKKTSGRASSWRNYSGYSLDKGLYALSAIIMDALTKELQKRMKNSATVKKGNDELVKMLLTSDSNPLSFREVAITGGKESQIKARNLANIFSGVSEIMNSAHRLQDYEIYLRKFPYRKDGVHNSSYILHLVVGYNNEIYLLKERCKLLARRLGKMFRKHQAHAEVIRRTDIAIKFLTDILDSSLNVRGKHVHDSSIKYLQIERLETLELLMLSNETLYQPLYRVAVRDAKRHFLKSVTGTNKTITKAINVYSALLISIVAFRRKLSLPPIQRTRLAKFPKIGELIKSM